VGTARLHVHPSSRPRALVVLGHGAGRGTDTADLLGLARDLSADGVQVVLVDQPWVVAGRRIAAAPATLDQAWLAVLDGLRQRLGLRPRLPVVVGGRSAGARVACRTAVATGADAVLLLACPLVPPAARADADKHAAALAKRRAELLAPVEARIPVVVAQGERDAFGTAAELRDLVRRSRLVEIVEVPDADHSLRTRAGGPDPGPVLQRAAMRAVARARGE
jgi:predicted alpha/beta-hydrolase family hydrolase